MRGWLVVNEFLKSQKFDEIHDWLIQSGERLGIELEIKTNGALVMDFSSQGCSLKNENQERKVDFVLFWDKDIRLAQYLEQSGYPVYNSSRAIGLCDDKTLTHLALMDSNVAMPRTVILPMTFSNIGYSNFDFLHRITETLDFPMIVKEGNGSFGQQVYMVNTFDELKECISVHSGVPLLVQEFIKSSNGRDVRLQVVGEQVVAAMYRYSENGDFRANITSGGKMKGYTPSKEQEQLAIDCCKKLGLDFAGVDLLFGENEEPILCEVNSNAHFKNIHDATGINVADHILSYIKDKVEARSIK